MGSLQTSQSEIETQIRDYIVKDLLFGDDPGLEPDTSFQESGIIDSTGMLQIITFVEGQFGIHVEDDELVPETFGSLRKVARFIERKVDAEAGSA